MSMSRCKSSHQHHSGFTLVELVVVIVVLSIIAVIGGGFIVKSAESHRSSMTHAKLVQQTRQALERSSRELRHALPNSLRISSDQRCLEWLPVVGVGQYEEQVAGRSISSLKTTPITVNLEAHYLGIGALHADELYGADAAALRPLSSVLRPGAPAVTSLNMSSDISFPRDSSGRRVFLLGQAKQLCLQNGRFTLHESYSTGAYPPATLTGNAPNTGALLTHIAPTADARFELESASAVRNSIVIVSLPVQQAGQQLVLEHRVMVRNAP